MTIKQNKFKTHLLEYWKMETQDSCYLKINIFTNIVTTQLQTLQRVYNTLHKTEVYNETQPTRYMQLVKPSNIFYMTKFDQKLTHLGRSCWICGKVWKSHTANSYNNSVYCFVYSEIELNYWFGWIELKILSAVSPD